MSGILESVPNLLGYSVPTIMVIAGLVLFFLPYFRDTPPPQARSARLWGFVFSVVGIVLALVIEPPAPQQQLIPIYILPTPLTGYPADVDNSTMSTDDTAPGDTSAALRPTDTPRVRAVGASATPSDLPTHNPDQTIAPTSIGTPETSTGQAQPVVVTELPPSPTPPAPPAAQTLPPATNTPEPITSVVPVWAFEESGVRVNVSTSGAYRIAFLGDAYSPWPTEQSEGYRGWTNTVRVYVNRPIEWGQTEYGLVSPVNQDAYVGPGGYFLDKDQAIASAVGDSRTLRLSAGDYLMLVTLDERGRYSDNQGKVDIGVTYLGQ